MTAKPDVRRLPRTQTVPVEKWRWYGEAAHFICADGCRFHLATEIGRYIISTVGRYLDAQGVEQTVGIDRTYETFVFRWKGRCDCGCGLPRIIPSEIDTLPANTPAEAQRNHMTLCRKWAGL